MTPEIKAEFDAFWVFCKPKNHLSTMRAYLGLRRQNVSAGALLEAARAVAANTPVAYRPSPDAWLRQGDWQQPPIPPPPPRGRPPTRYEEGLAFLKAQKRELAAKYGEDPDGVVIDGTCDPNPTWSGF